MNGGISRRSFIGAAAGAFAVASTATVLGGCAASPSSRTDGSTSKNGGQTSDSKTWSFEVAPDSIKDDQISRTVSADIVVVGAGVSGIPAAAVAAEMGATVQCIEKQGAICSTRPTGFSCFGSSKLKELGVMSTEAEKDQLVCDIWGGQNATGDQALVQLWADESGAFADWLCPIVENAGIPVTVGGFFGYYNHNKSLEEAQLAMKENPLQVRDSYWQFYPVQHQFGSSQVPGVSMWSTESPEAMAHDADWLSPVYEYALDQGAKFDFLTTAMQLVREEGWEDDPTKRITAVIAQDSSGEYIKYEASKGVILATGGFDFDDEMLEAYYPIGLRMARTWQTWFTGDGHKMAWWIGAKVDEQLTSHAMGTCASAECMKSSDKIMPPEEVAHVVPWQEWNMPSTAMAPCLWVNNRGERFINEETGYFMSMARIDAQPEHMYWGVWDSEWRTKIEPHHMDRIMDGNDSEERMKANVEAGMAIQADTIDVLIEKMGVVNGEAFKQTLDEYNSMCVDGKDKDFLKPARYLSTVDTPPYYAAQMGGSWMTTCGGVAVDTSFRVLDSEDKVIPGLYAGGNPAGGFYGNIYAPQIPMSLSGHSMTFSWLAAKNVVNEL